MKWNTFHLKWNTKIVFVLILQRILRKVRCFYWDVTGTYAMRTRCEWEWVENESDNIRGNQHREKRANGGSAHRTP